MPVCKTCEEKVNLGDVYCSSKCKETYYESLKVIVPHIYVRRLYQFYKRKEIPAQIRQYSRRHGFRPDLVRKKINNIATQYGYIAS